MDKPSIILILAFLFSFNIQGQTISSVKFGDIKLKAPVDSINKYVDNQVAVHIPKYLGNDVYDYVYDTVFTTYKNFTVKLIINSYYDYQTKKIKTELTNIFTDDIKIKTKSGIKIGDNKYDVIKKLEGSYLIINPDEKKRKEYSTVVLQDSGNGCQLSFYFKNNLLYATECSLMEYDD
jgi:hypothetical protein